MMASTGQRHSGWRVGFDLDGVVYDFRRAISDYLVNTGRTDCSLDRALSHWDFYEGWGLTLDEYLDLYEAGVDAGQVLRYGDPFPGSVEATEALERAGHTIHIVTDRSVGSRPGISSRHTAAWLADHNFVFHSLTFSSDKTAVDTDFFIDDRFENYTARVAKGLNCHLLTRPWNQDLGDRDTQRVDSLEEFVEIVLGTATASTHNLAMTTAL
jgi:5' nucleotidase, deoxy (Pyrimidine), cytosolic type C protein (NT5C)